MFVNKLLVELFCLPEAVQSVFVNELSVYLFCLPETVRELIRVGLVIALEF